MPDTCLLACRSTILHAILPLHPPFLIPPTFPALCPTLPPPFHLPFSRPSPHPSSSLSPAFPPALPPPFLPPFQPALPLPLPAVPLPAVPPPPDPDLLDPCPDITALFRHYNDLYFQGRLGACLVEWSSKRMTLCAGVCMYDGALCRIRLSAPLLQYRPVSDLKATLLHEMIHAFIFLCRPSHSRE
ncbi:unnamed protein product [Closterium sp. Naga37s-1]|nr:unnamed protein product [Closterium sp. Naga37s-1]